MLIGTPQDVNPTLETPENLLDSRPHLSIPSLLNPNKMTAKELFANREYRAAEEAFLLLAADDLSSDREFRGVQYSNAAQCAINLHEYVRASDHARAGVKIAPYNPKAHYRLATALSKSPFPKNPVDAARRSCDIATANACAQALVSTSLPIQGLDLIANHNHTVSRRAADLLQTIAARECVLVRSYLELNACTGVAVVPPNCTLSHLSRQDGGGAVHIVGLHETSKLACSVNSPHSLFIMENVEISVWNLQLLDAQMSMVCTVGNTSIINCKIINRGDNAVLVSGTSAFALVAFCEFQDCTAGVEIREGGSAHLVGCKIRRMERSGISAYAGAKTLTLEDTLVEDVGFEGVQCIGPRAPNEFLLGNAFAEAGFPTQENVPNTEAHQIAQAATEAARRDGDTATLQVTLRNCYIRRCGINSSRQIRSGVTAAEGAVVAMTGCLVESCSMAGLFVKGGSIAIVKNCRFEFGSDYGVRVDVNYNADVSVSHSVFIGKQGKAIFNALKSVSGDIQAYARTLGGASTKPIVQFNNQHFARPRNAPSIDSLRNSVENSPISFPVAQGQAVKPGKPARAGALYRQLGFQHTYTDYPIGNTYGRDLLRGTKLKDSPPDREIRIILCACGDIRNVVETICARNANESSRITFVMNDASPAILARNIVLLELACRLWQKNGSTRKGAAATWLHAWGSVALTKSDRSFLDTIIKNLAAGKLPAWLVGLPKEVRKSLTMCWNSWGACSKSLSDIRNQRAHFCPNINAVSQKAASAAGLSGIGNTPTELIYAELLKGKGDSVNPTLLSVPGLDYNMAESSIFRALDLRSYVNGDASKLLSGARSALSKKGKRVSASLRSNKARILALPGDLSEVLNSEVDADVVDMSNAMDYISKPVCMLVGSRCIRRPGGILLMHTMMVREGDERTNAEVERDTMLGAKGIHLREALGLQTLAIEEDDNVGDTIVREKGSWAYGTSARVSDEGTMWLGAMEWCRGPLPPKGATLLRLGGWPTAIIALVISAHALPGCSWKEVVQRMIQASPKFAAFEWQLNAHAAVADRLPTVVVGITLGPVKASMTMGLTCHLLLKISLGSDDEHIEGERPGDAVTTKWFDIFDWNTSRGVLEILMCEEDIPLLREGNATICAVNITTGIIQCTSREVTHLAEENAIVSRKVSEEEEVLILSALSSPESPSG